MCLCRNPQGIEQIYVRNRQCSVQTGYFNKEFLHWDLLDKIPCYPGFGLERFNVFRA